MFAWLAFEISIMWELLFDYESLSLSRVYYRTSIIWLLLEIAFGDAYDKYVEKREREKVKRKIAKSGEVERK